VYGGVSGVGRGEYGRDSNGGNMFSLSFQVINIYLV
jgi:hypothetical protein